MGLREKTGAGMMDCKKALKETDGDINKAVDWLRQKGIASAGKLEGKVATEGLVESYIHTGGRIGVLVEVNCQTDFVARNEAFKELVKNVAMQIAACPQVEYVSVDDIPTEFVESEKSIEMGLKELTLMDQPYIRDQNKTLEEFVRETSAQLGEKVQVRRFIRFVLGEGIEKQESNFVEEVAAQTGNK